MVNVNINEYPESFEDQLSLGWKLLQDGKNADALFIAKKIVEDNSDHPFAWSLLAHARHEWGEIDEALLAIKKAIEIEPREPQFYYYMGSFFETQQKMDKAIENYRKALSIDPANTSYKVTLGQAYLTLRMFDDSIDILEKCIVNEPNNEECSNALAIAYNDKVVSTYMKLSSNDIYFIDNKEAAEESIKYLRKAKELKNINQDLKGKIEKNIQYTEWSLSKHYSQSFKSTVIMLVVAFVLVLIIQGTTKSGVIAVIAGILIVFIYVYFSFIPGYKISKRKLTI